MINNCNNSRKWKNVARLRKTAMLKARNVLPEPASVTTNNETVPSATAVNLRHLLYFICFILAAAYAISGLILAYGAVTNINSVLFALTHAGFLDVLESLGVIVFLAIPVLLLWVFYKTIPTLSEKSLCFIVPFGISIVSLIL